MIYDSQYIWLTFDSFYRYFLEIKCRVKEVYTCKLDLKKTYKRYQDGRRLKPVTETMQNLRIKAQL